jgi:quercetin 2,3-dioxygenase
MFPNKKNVKPRWDAKEFPKEPVTDKLKALVTGFNDPDSDSLKIYQDTTIFAGRMNKGTVIKQKIEQQAYVLCSYGKLCLNDTELSRGDGAEIVNLQEISITAQEDCEVLLIDLPKY